MPNPRPRKVSSKAIPKPPANSVVPVGTPFCAACGAHYADYGYWGLFFCEHHAPVEVLDEDPEQDIHTILED